MSRRERRAGVEQVRVATRAKAAKRRRRPAERRRIPRWLLPLVVLGAVGFLYVRPIDSYLETRNQLHERRAEVAMLRAERARLSTRLEQETSVEGLARQARRIGYVRPGEHLFIVEGTAAWAKQHGR
jgi:cell division protein FtsB